MSIFDNKSSIVAMLWLAAIGVLVIFFGIIYWVYWFITSVEIIVK